MTEMRMVLCIIIEYDTFLTLYPLAYCHKSSTTKLIASSNLILGSCQVLIAWEWFLRHMARPEMILAANRTLNLKSKAL